MAPVVKNWNYIFSSAIPELDTKEKEIHIRIWKFTDDIKINRFRD